VVVAPHLSNFDLAGQAFALRGWPFQVLSYPQPGKGYQWQNQFRSQAGMQVTPMSLVSLRQAKERLKRGGIVLTGMDRPVAGSNYRPKFFGRPAGMPVAYIRLAMETNVPVMVVACQTQPDGSYLVRGSELLWMLPHSNLKAGIETNAERVLKEAEKFICLAPQQWSMTFPVWPEALLEVP
jgi:lauroyl/myristoyl acyltransferase